jgi:hypothetical protein
MISLILFFLAGIVDAARDFVGFRLEQSIFYKYNPQFWNTDKSWKNKYKLPLQVGKKHWYNFGYIPAFEEKFPYSTTIFVGLTDAWHMLKTMYLLFMFFGVVCYTTIVGLGPDFFICWISYSISFNLFIEKIFNRIYWKYK